MKVNELVEKVNGVNTVSRIITAKNYLPFEEKRKLVKMVLEKCTVVDENGYSFVDELQKYIIFTIEVIKAYTDIEFDIDVDNAIKEYDLLCEKDLLNEIISTFAGEYKTVLGFIDMEQSNIDIKNGIEYKFGQFLHQLEGVIGDVIYDLSEKIGSFDFENLNISKDDLNKLNDFMKMFNN